MAHWMSQDHHLYTAMPVSAMGLGGAQFVPRSDSAYRRASGAFGLAGLGDFNVIDPGVVKGRLRYDGYDLGLPAPAGIAESGLKHLFIYNKQMAALYDLATNRDAEESVLHVWTPQSGKWTSLRVPGQFPYVKGIGTWILGAASSRAKGRVSPGQAERQKRVKDQKEGKSNSQKAKPDTDKWFNGFGRYYPGTLFAIDTTNGKMITWQTGQGDSEILLIRGDTFIYRVNDTLYNARIEGATIGPPQLLAQDEAVPEMHWAFSSRQ